MLKCTHCGRPLTRDASEGAHPLGPVGPVCAASLGVLPVKADPALTVGTARQAPRVRVVRAAVNGTTWHDPRQIALPLEVAC